MILNLLFCWCCYMYKQTIIEHLTHLLCSERLNVSYFLFWYKGRHVVTSVMILCNSVTFIASVRLFWRVWKGIFGIRDLTKIWCGNRENDKYIDGIRDLTVPQEAGLAKIWAWDAGFMFACLSGMPETVMTHRF